VHETFMMWNFHSWYHVGTQKALDFAAFWISDFHIRDAQLVLLKKNGK
jgi:hypothetical protein